MAGSDYIFNYLNDLWDLLPEQDRLRMGETWKAYEQTYGSVWMKMFERDMGVNIDYLPLYNNQRWLKHLFNDDSRIFRAAKYRSNQDLSKGIDLSARYLIRFSIDGASPVEVDLRGLIPAVTTLQEIIDKINFNAGATVAFAVLNNQLLEIVSPTTGPTSSILFLAASTPSADASASVLGLDPDYDLPKQIPEFPFEYLLTDKFIASIPTLQNRIHEEMADVILTQGVDYTIEFGTGIISFKDLPPESLWAKDNLVNVETPYHNFGYLMDLYDSNTASYLKAVKGLWFAFWTGPRPENIRRSLYLLFGLPTASAAGVVKSVSNTQVVLTYTDGTEETFAVPTDLVPLVVEGEVVSRFQPLVDGISVFDKINYPGFLRKEVGRIGVAPFLTEKATLGTDPGTDESKALYTVEQNTYLPQIDVNAFISPDIKIKNVKSFLTNIQPRSRTYLFQVLVGNFRDKLDILDEGNRTASDSNFPNGLPSLIFKIAFDVTPNIDYNPNTEIGQADLDDTETNDFTHNILDSDGFAFGDRVQIDVFQAALPTDSFSLEG